MKVKLKNHDTGEHLGDVEVSAVPGVDERIVLDGEYWRVFQRVWHLGGTLAGSIEIALVRLR